MRWIHPQKNLPPEEGELKPASPLGPMAMTSRPEPPAQPIVLGPPPSAVGHRGAVEFQRGPAWWYSIMERSYAEAVEKLTFTIKNDVKADPAPLASVIPCLVDIEEGHTREEKERIRRAHRRMSRVFANLVDRLVRYRPESRLFAFDSAQQEIQDSRALWKDYECTKFRTVIEAKETEKKRKKNSGNTGPADKMATSEAES